MLPSEAKTVASELIFAGADPVAISIISCVVFSSASLEQYVYKIAVDIRYMVFIMSFCLHGFKNKSLLNGVVIHKLNNNTC